jgi:hypothetical protein
MTEISLNLWVVLVAAVVNMVVGAIWYSPGVFGKIWMHELGLDKMNQSGMAKSYLITFIGALVMAYVTALVVGFSNATTITDGLIVGFWLWLGFAVTLPLNDVIFGKKSWTLYMLNITYYLVVLLINGVLLATWH